MKVLHLIGGSLLDGASKGALLLHNELIRRGVNSIVLCTDLSAAPANNVYSIHRHRRGQALDRLLLRLDSFPAKIYPRRKRILFSTGWFGYDITKLWAYENCDLVHLHWVNKGFVSYQGLSKVTKPLVWTLRDMWPMTGGCHHSLECTKFRQRCGACPQLNSSSPFDLSTLVFKLKQNVLPKNTAIVGISHWITDQAQTSALMSSLHCQTIMNSVDTDLFRPVDKLQARVDLRIKSTKKILLIGATAPTDSYKGFDHFLSALGHLDAAKYHICAFGHLPNNALEGLGFSCQRFGYIMEPKTLRTLYAAADVFVAPSIAESFGKTLAEAHACGTPVVCFDATGPRDIVDHRITGYRAVPYDASDLAYGIDWIAKLSDDEYAQLCLNARERACRHFSTAVIADRYIELYRSLVS